jgi:Type IV secretion-system coupling protein DNA-binding domain
MKTMSVVHIGRVDFRDRDDVFGIKTEDRFSHIYIIGKTGTGKSTLLENMAAQDLACGRSFALIDPHGDLAEKIASRVETSGRRDVIYLNPADPKQPYGYNPLRQVRPEFISLAASGLIEVLKKMWADSWGVRMEHILRNVLLALLEQPNVTLQDVLRLLSENKYRKQIAAKVRNETVRRFLEHEFERFTFGYRADGIAPIQNKIGAFLADPLLNRILTAPKKELSIRRIMDSGGVLLVNLSKGRLGEDSSALLGGLVVTTVGLAAFSRADLPAEARKEFFVYVDEFQSFTTLALVNMFSELRKYRVGFTVAHQYIHQLEPEIRHAILGNAGTLIAFRVGAEDAPILAQELHDQFGKLDLLQLPNYRVYTKLMIDGTPSKPFSALTVAP